MDDHKRDSVAKLGDIYSARIVSLGGGCGLDSSGGRNGIVMIRQAIPRFTNQKRFVFHIYIFPPQTAQLAQAQAGEHINLQAFFNECGKNGNQARKGGLAPKTLTNLRNMMHMAFGQAVKNHLLQENLIEDIRLPKATKTEMRVLSREGKIGIRDARLPDAPLNRS